MAPSAVETTTETSAPAPSLKLHSTLNGTTQGAYRLFGRNFDKEAEQGKKDHPAAKVSIYTSALSYIVESELHRAYPNPIVSKLPPNLGSRAEIPTSRTIRAS